MLSPEERGTGFKRSTVQNKIRRRGEREGEKIKDIPGNRENIHTLMITRSFPTFRKFRTHSRKEKNQSNRIESKREKIEEKTVRGRSRESKESFAQSFEFNFELKETQQNSENKRTGNLETRTQRWT